MKFAALTRAALACLSIVCCSACTAAEGTFSAASPPSGRSPSAIGEPEVYELSTDDAEVVAVAARERGNVVFVVSPAPACGGEGDPSMLPILEQGRTAPYALEETAVVDLGPGESTSVAASPRGDLVLVARKDPHRPNVNPGHVLFVQGERIARTIHVGTGPDSIAVSPDGRFAVVACEGDVPDSEDCPAGGDESEDVAGSIVVIDLGGGPDRARIAAVVTGEAIFRRFFEGEPTRAMVPAQIEPEFVAIAPDSSYALVTLQEQSAVAIVDLAPLRQAPSPDARQPAPEEAGNECLADVIMLPHEGRDTRGGVRGVHPDGIAISPDGRLAVTANEAHAKVRGLQGISIIDLRGGPRRAKVAATHSIFDLDPTLGAASTPKKGKKFIASKRRAVSARKAARDQYRLPRLDPEGVALCARGGRTIAAIAIERRLRMEDGGSVLFLDVTEALSGGRPTKIDRKTVGATEEARPETVAFSPDGRFLFVASERDGGTITLIDTGA